MIGLQEYRHSLCPNCGQPQSECWIPDEMSDGELVKFSAKTYEAGYNRCASCQRISYEQGVLRSMEKNTGEEFANRNDFRHWYVKRL